MKLLTRLLLLLLSATLLAATVGLHESITRHLHDHVVIYIEKVNHLHEIQQGALYGVLAWCVLFAKSEPVLVRVGLIAVIVSLLVMTLPLKSY